jgi:hypothetical protein
VNARRQLDVLGDAWTKRARTTPNGCKLGHDMQVRSAKEQQVSSNRVTAWVGWVWFAAFALITSGLFNIIAGFVAVFDDDKILALTGSGAAIVDVSTWGWVHLVLGALLTLVGFVLFGGAPWARAVAAVLVVLNLLAQFVSLPVTPWWSLTIIVIDVVILWALIVHGDETERAVR